MENLGFLLQPSQPRKLSQPSVGKAPPSGTVLPQQEKKPSGFIIYDDGKGRCKDDPDWVRRRPPAAAPMNPKRQATSTHHAMKMRVLPSSAIATVNSTSMMMKITDARCCCAELVLVSTICTFLEKLSLNSEGGGKLGARAPY